MRLNVHFAFPNHSDEEKLGTYIFEGRFWQLPGHPKIGPFSAPIENCGLLIFYKFRFWELDDG